MGRQRHERKDDDGHRDARHGGLTEGAEACRKIELPGGREEGPCAAKQEQRGQRDDERNDPQGDDEERIDRADCDPHHDRHHKRATHADTVVAHRQTRDQGGKVHRRSDRQVDARRQQDEDHAHRRDTDE